MSCQLSVITPIYNSTGTLRIFLESVFVSEFRDFELIIVDDCSQDDPQGILQGRDVIYWKLSKRGGSANARNEGAGISQGKILLFLDPDITIRPDTLGDIVRTFGNHPEAAGMIGSYDEDPGAKNFVSQFKFLFHHYVHHEAGSCVGSFWTGCGAIRKEVFNDTGAFDTTFFKGLNTINDIEFGYRLKQRGFKVINAKDVQVKHWKRLSFWEWIWSDIFDRGAPWVKIMLKYHDFEPTLNFSGKNIFCVLCVWVLVLSLFLAFVNFGFFAVALAALVSIVFIQGTLIRYLYTRRGLQFSLCSISLLLIYYFNCGLSIILGLLMQKEL